MDIGNEMRIIEVDEPTPEPITVESMEESEKTTERTDTYPKAI